MYNPYAKGRWYRIFLESDGETVTVESDDLNITYSANYLVFPKGFHHIDHKYDISSNFTHESTTGVNKVLRFMTDGSQAIEIPPKTHYDYLHLYVFGYFE